jgi:flagellar motor switch protein FliN/FliY
VAEEEILNELAADPAGDADGSGFESFSDDGSSGVDDQDGQAAGKKHDLDFILDIPLRVSVELGRTKMLINDLLQLGQGSVVELNKLAGEPMEVLVNDKLVARGEVVVVNEKFGVRLTDIISPMERIEQLK